MTSVDSTGASYALRSPAEVVEFLDRFTHSLAPVRSRNPSSVALSSLGSAHNLSHSSLGSLGGRSA